MQLDRHSPSSGSLAGTAARCASSHAVERTADMSRLANVYVQQAHEHEMIARALLRVGRLLDDAEAGKRVEAHPVLNPDDGWDRTATAWMIAAILIADRTEIDSMTLTAMAASVFKGEQDALFD